MKNHYLRVTVIIKNIADSNRKCYDRYENQKLREKERGINGRQSREDHLSSDKL